MGTPAAGGFRERFGRRGVRGLGEEGDTRGGSTPGATTTIVLGAQSSPHDVAVDPVTNAVYLATSGTDSVTATVAVTGGRSGVADDPARRRTHVASFVTDKVTGLSG